MYGMCTPRMRLPYRPLSRVVRVRLRTLSDVYYVCTHHIIVQISRVRRASQLIIIIINTKRNNTLPHIDMAERRGGRESSVGQRQRDRCARVHPCARSSLFLQAVPGHSQTCHGLLGRFAAHKMRTIFRSSDYTVYTTRWLCAVRLSLSVAVHLSFPLCVLSYTHDLITHISHRARKRANCCVDMSMSM